MRTGSGAIDHFVGHLEALREREDRGALAHLRRGLGKEPGEAAEMHPLILPWLPSGLPPWHEDAYYLVAALFAMHPEPGGTGSLGAAFARLAAATGSRSIEARFVALLNCHEDDFPVHLRHAVSLLRSKSIPLDWRQLLQDVQRWGHPARSVQRHWARDFWTSAAEPPTGTDSDVSN